MACVGAASHGERQREGRRFHCLVPCLEKHLPHSHLPVCKEVVALVIHNDERREVHNLNAPHGLHAQVLVLDQIHLLDAVLSEVGSSSTYASQVESSVLLAGVRHALGAVALRQRDHRVAVLLKERHVGVHAARRRGAEAPAGVAVRGLCGACVVDHVGSHVVRQGPLRLQALCELRVCNVSRNDDGAREGQPRLDGVSRQCAQNVLHWPVQVHRDRLAAYARARPHPLKEACRVPLELLDEHAVVCDLGQDLAIRAARDAYGDRAGGAVPRHADDPDVVHKVLASVLRADPEAVTHPQHLLLPPGVAVGAATIVSCRREVVQVAGRSKLHRLEAELCGQPSDDNREVVWRASGGAQSHDLLCDEGLKGLRVQQRLRLLEEIRLVG
mmetsp:Transcript_99449/g.315640  ORF Transcript_99449/g.315640 Transcript_99449/m.315640 type:complete len:386 (-) Transcript_99449:1024-2181(-)